MERKLSLPIYVSAFIATLMIFVIGIAVGHVIDTSAMGGISDDMSSLSHKVSAVQLLMLMEGNSSSSCPVYLSELGAIDDEVEKVGYRLSYMEDEKGVFDSELKKQYFVLEAESYLLSGKAKTLCNDKSVLLINFYSNKDCARCREQGTEILKARDDLVSKVPVKLYSFDGELNSPVADALVAQYNVTSYPTILIDGKGYSGFHTADQLKEILLRN